MVASARGELERDELTRQRIYAAALGALAAAFLGRVVGQVAVALLAVDFLPPMSAWYSGLLAYPLLLASQVAILVFQVAQSRQLWRASGVLTVERPALGTGLKWTSAVYALGMVVRYVLTMWLVPEQRWFGGTIPIFFHEVLALYLYLLSRYHRGL
jgi:hypothetical protein